MNYQTIKSRITYQKVRSSTQNRNFALSDPELVEGEPKGFLQLFHRTNFNKQSRRPAYFIITVISKGNVFLKIHYWSGAASNFAFSSIVFPSRHTVIVTVSPTFFFEIDSASPPFPWSIFLPSNLVMISPTSIPPFAAEESSITC